MGLVRAIKDKLLESQMVKSTQSRVDQLSNALESMILTRRELSHIKQIPQLDSSVNSGITSTHKAAVGTLLLHGLSSNPDVFLPLVANLDETWIPYSIPTLQKHGSSTIGLLLNRSKQMLKEAEHALITLHGKVERVVIIGDSTGGLLAFDLAQRHPDLVDGIISLSTCIDPQKSRAQRISPFHTDRDYTLTISKNLDQIHVPIRIMQSVNDPLIEEDSANTIFEKVRSPIRELIWYEGGHELLQSAESSLVIEDILDFVDSISD